ncbi:MAG: PAS domain-containing sensor histidine kinase [Magnetovibrionaceae bacterium]
MEGIVPQTDMDEHLALTSLLVDASDDLMSVVGPDYRYRLVNKTYEVAHAIKRSDIVGRHMIEILGKDFFENQVKPQLDAAMAGEEIRFEAWFDFKAIGRRAVLVHFKRLDSLDGHLAGVLVTVRDITVRKNAQDALERAKGDLEAKFAERTRALLISEQRSRDLVETATDWFWETDKDFRFTFVSQRFTAVTGILSEEIIGKTRFELSMDLDETEKWSQHRADLENRRPFKNFRYGYGLPDGREKYAAISGLPVFDDAGEFLGYRGAATDITDQIQVEKALRLAKEKAEQADRAKTEFLANMSHELRTPLNAILGFSSVLQGELFGPLGHDKYREYADDIQASGGHLLEVISDILDVSKIEAGALELHEEPLDVAATVKAACRLIRPRAEAGSINLVTDLDPDLRPLVVDELRFKQILVNLLSNAVKFSPRKGIVQVTAEVLSDDAMVIRVSDQGPGMTPDQVRTALTPFGQVESALDRSHEGTGLGLPLAEGLMRLHGGRLEIDTEPGRGTTASLIFPARTPSA